MKDRAKRYLAYGIPIHTESGDPHPRQRWRPTRRQMERGFSHQHLRALEQEALGGLSTLAFRRELLWHMSELRRVLQRSKRAGVSTRYEARLLKRLRNLLAKLPNPRALPADMLQALLDETSLSNTDSAYEDTLAQVAA